MKKTQHLVFCTFIIILCAVFAGCASNATKLQKIVDENKDMFVTEETTEGAFDFFVRDDSLVYSIKFKSMAKEDINPDVLSNSIGADEIKFQALLNELKLNGIKSPRVVVEFLDTHGDLIYSREFK